MKSGFLGHRQPFSRSSNDRSKKSVQALSFPHDLIISHGKWVYQYNGDHEAYITLECSERKAERKGLSFPQTRESMSKLISLRDSVLTDYLSHKEFLLVFFFAKIL